MKIEGMNLWDRLTSELEWLFKGTKEIWVVYGISPGGHKKWQCLCASREDAEKSVKFLLDDSIPVPPQLAISESHFQRYEPLWYRIFHKKEREG